MFGTLNGKQVVCMQGRFHYYEGYSLNKVIAVQEIYCGAIAMMMMIVTMVMMKVMMIMVMIVTMVMMMVMMMMG